MSLASALDGLAKAIESLEAAVDERGAAAPPDPAVLQREEVQRLNADRAALANQLDVAEDRAQRLADANAEVSRRIVSAMETVRTVLDRA